MGFPYYGNISYNIGSVRGKISSLESELYKAQEYNREQQERAQRDAREQQEKVRRENQQNIARQIQQVQVSKEQVQQPQKKVIPSGASVESLTKRGFLFLEDSDWEKASEYFDNALDLNPEYAQAYIGLLCAELKISNESELGNQLSPLNEKSNFKKAIRFADTVYREKLEAYAKATDERIAEAERLRQERIAEEERRKEEEACKKKEEEYNKLVEAMYIASTESEYEELAEAFHRMQGYKDTSELLDKCFEKVTELRALEHERKEQERIEREKRIPELKKVRERIQIYYDCIHTGSHTVGLKNDGTVVAVGNNEDRQCEVGSWRDIVAISAGNDHTVGLKNDGTVVAVGINKDGRCNVDSWRDIGPVDKQLLLEQEKKRKAEKQRDVENTMRIFAENEMREFKLGQEKARLQEKNRRDEEQSKLWQQQGLCRHCGGQMGGLFTKKCKSCGRTK